MLQKPDLRLSTLCVSLIMNWLERLQKRWKLQSITQVLLVLCVFALTGFTVLFIKPIILGALGIERGGTWWMTILYLLVVFPLYLLLLLFYALLLGQYNFFRAYVGKTFSRFRKKKKGEKVEGDQR